MNSNKRPRWKLIATLFVGVVAGTVALCLLIGKAQGRKEFVGNVDPTSGYRCRFTLASSWRVSARDIDISPGVLDNAVFKPVPQNPIKAWMDRVLLHREAARQPMIGLTTVTSKDAENYSAIQFEAGYPEMKLGRPQRILKQRRLWIDSCPATVVTFGSASPRFHPHTVLTVSVPDRSIIFSVMDGIAQSDDMNREMQAILSSFHIERVAVQASSKR